MTGARDGAGGGGRDDEGTADGRRVHRLRQLVAGREPHRLILPELRECAVLLPVLVRDEGASLLFIEKAAGVHAHAGQVGFPGGRREPADRDLVATALREADEEIGLAAADVEVIGVLDDVPTTTGYVITPVVGLVHRVPAGYRLQGSEIAAAFEVPVRALADPAVYSETGRVERLGRTWVLSVYRVGERNIWGATARIVAWFLELWHEARDP